MLVAFAERALGHARDAEDVAQEAMLKICSRISSFDRQRDGVSWAFGIASFEVMTQRKRRSRRREESDEPLQAHADVGASAEEQLANRQLLAALEDALGQLPPAELALLGIGAMPQLEMGATVRKRRQRAMERLRAIWRRLNGEPR